MTLLTDMAWKHGAYRFATLIGARFGRLAVIARDETVTGRGKNSKWICRCDCGTTRSVQRTSLVNSRATSCGCYGKWHRALPETEGMRAWSVQMRLLQGELRVPKPKGAPSRVHICKDE